MSGTCDDLWKPYVAALGVLMILAAMAPAEPPFVFRDVAREAGLLPDAGEIAGHAAAWGDMDGDGWPDLYVATFGGEPYGSKANMLFRNVQGQFKLDPQKAVQVVGRASGAVFADLDNDGDLDLYLSNHAISGGDQYPHYETPNVLFRNEGGQLADVSEASGVCPPGMAARSVAAVDYDGDGLLDLLVGEDFFQGGQSRSRLYRNLGDFKFENVTTAVGLPEQTTGFGVAAGDVNNDGWPDLFLSGRNGGNRLFLNDGQGRFKEVPASHADFPWTYTHDPEDTTCGVAFGDLNRDGLLDIVMGSHYDRPWQIGGVPLRLYLNRGVQDGWPRFEEVTQAAGLVPLPMKSPHVEVQDFDNDGWPDIYTSIVKFADGQAHPVIFKHLGMQEEGAGEGGGSGEPRFRADALAVNDFPTPDVASGPDEAFYKKMLEQDKLIYMAAAPSADFDRDGRVDLFLANWWVHKPSLLLRNETQGGHWLQVTVAGEGDVNTQGIGSQVRIYAPGKLGQAQALVGMYEIAAGFGYASGQEAVAHLGLGDLATCDVEVILPHGKGRLVRQGVKAGQRISMTAADRGD